MHTTGDTEELIPLPPDPSPEDWRTYEETGNFIPLFFEWYKFVATLVNVMSFVQPDSPAFAPISKHSYYALSGLLHRCARLMLGNVALSHGGKFGETTAIIDRCLCETAVTIMWLCDSETDHRVQRYMGSGLKSEIEFELSIRDNIENRGEPTPLEARMLASIERHFQAANLTREEVKSTKKLPALATMIDAVGHRRLDYIVLQRMGSHHIHGTWPSLLLHYLTKSDIDGFAFQPRGMPSEMHLNQYVHGCRFVLGAAASFASCCLLGNSRESFVDLAEEALEQILKHFEEAIRRGH